MAGSMAVVLYQNEEAERSDSSAAGMRWQVTFARFLHFPTSVSGSDPSLDPVRQTRPHGAIGTWLSGCSPTATLQLVCDDSRSDAILSVYFKGKMLEEHYISRLQFLRPQVSCVNGFPSRGTRAVFAIFKDAAGLIQKFAVQFLTTSEADVFMGFLKELLEEPAAAEPRMNDLRSEMSTYSAVVRSTDMPLSSDHMEESSAMSPTCTYSPELPLNITHGVDDPMLTDNTNNSSSNNNTSSSFTMPPSFTSLVGNCCSETKQGETEVAEDGDLKSRIAKYMEDASFEDMLFKVEKVLGEIGYDLVL